MIKIDKINDFGYIDDKPFKECDTDKQIFSLININNDGIEFKANGISSISFWDIEKTPKVIYAVDSNLAPITALRIFPGTTEFSAISTSIYKSDLYFIGQKATIGGKIKHFTTSTKIHELIYYNDSLSRIFFNDSFVYKYKLKKNILESITIKGKKKANIEIGNINMQNNNSIKLILAKDFKCKHQFNDTERITIEDNSHLILKYKKGVCFDEVYKDIRLIDSSIYLMTHLKRRHKKIEIKDFRKNTYLCKDFNIEKIGNKANDIRFLICNREDSKEVFCNILQNFYRIYDEDKNALFSFLEYDSSNSSLEIKFLEYYKTIEYIKMLENKEKGKGIGTKFLLDILSENQSLKKCFFGNQEINNIEEEIRSLRNYYSHTGYYIKDLPIPTKNPKRVKKIDTKWLYNVLDFMKIATYYEMYKYCEINCKWEEFRDSL